MLHGLILAALLAGPAEAVAPAPPSGVEVLAVEVRSVSPEGVAARVASDPRFTALGPAEREALLRAVAIAPGWHVAASAANLVVGFGVGSLFEGDWRGLVLTATDTVALVALSLAWAGYMAGGSTESSTAAELIPVAAGVFVAGRIAGLVLPWTWKGRRHAATAAALGKLPPASPPASALHLAPLFVSASGFAVPGATLTLRF